MKLKAFRVRNYRSVIDSGWCELSPDHITGIIGQNESGKTSLLEALKSFYEGEINDDILRSDLSLPEVSCSFGIPAEMIRAVLNMKRVPEGLLQAFAREKELVLTRVWNEDKSSQVLAGGKEVEKIYDKLVASHQLKEEKLEARIRKILNETEKTRDQLKKLNQDREKLLRKLDLLKTDYSDREKRWRKRATGAEKEKLGAELEKMKEQIASLEKKAHEKAVASKKLSEKLDALIPLTEVSVAVHDTRRRVGHAEENREKIFRELIEIQQRMEYAPNEREQRAAQLKLDVTQELYLQANKQLQDRQEEYERKKMVASLVLGGKGVRQAVKETEEWFSEYHRLYSPAELGHELFQLIPSFELFEDFSSLLPNRIDLAEIIKEKSEAEGFKAARNFLIVSGLTPDFFRQANPRILKQKIENLNRETTVDFQDYWRQSLGKKNKIRIHFELEHYDASHPEKVGKPYLEFWIKDDYERLYPKQRSRGVRWFLSFYLELRATAIRQDTWHRVLLIDEPGLSLHARAQEDVLKVFEAVKDRIQIIYTTHSPHLIDINKLYRLLAVQRRDVEDERSETVVFNARSLQEASSDTLSPIYTLMGSRITEQKFIQPKNNIILEDVSSYYYLTTFFQLAGKKQDVFILPSTHVTNVGMLVNLLMGWGMEFIVILDDDEEGNRMYQEMKKNLFGNSDEKARRKICKLDSFQSMEDLFSTIDFKKYVLNKREGIPEKNSEYIENNGLSKSILAAGFKQRVQEDHIKFTHFDDETRENIGRLLDRINSMLT